MTEQQANSNAPKFDYVEITYTNGQSIQGYLVDLDSEVGTISTEHGNRAFWVESVRKIEVVTHGKKSFLADREVGTDDADI